MDMRSLSSNAGPENDVKLVNRLGESRSPYVRGHMKNPVAWQMWTPETLALAKRTNRLIFVSIGYAACHWCHVMERESFENNDVAAVLNASFVPIKIDREERPDVDRIYMNYVQATTGSGGWPLNVFITPDLEPIFGGTYWPGPGSASSFGDVGFLDILEKMRDVWATQRQRCLDSAKEITAQLRDFSQEGTISRLGGQESDGLDLDLLEEAYRHYAARFDTANAGFGGAPKFPTPANLRFLLHLGQLPQSVEDVVGREECENGRLMAMETLRAMNRGGIHDQIGHGFARYSVTRDWSLPHFEKMLYDQAQLLPLYLDAHIISKDPEMLEAAVDVATYLTSQPMARPSGGFFSAEDADSYYRPTDKEKREGAFYVWTLKEFQSILGDRDAEICAKYYSVEENGNVSPQHDAHDELINQNVLAVASTPEALAKEFGLTADEIVRILKNGRAKLLEHRERERPRPALDDKVVVSWNGLAIGALARIGAYLEPSDPTLATKFTEAALNAASFLREELYDEQSETMKRVYREGPGETPAFADDYAFLISGLIDLYEATFDDSFLKWADTLQKTQISLFWDTEHHGFFSTVPSPDLLLRLKDGLDNAEPSTNGTSAANLHRLSSLLADDSYATTAGYTCEAFEAEVMQHPFLFTSMMAAVAATRLGVRGLVLVGADSPQVDAAARRARERAGGIATVARLSGGGAKSEWLRERNALLPSVDLRRPSVQVCEGGVCTEELDLGDVERALRDIR